MATDDATHSSIYATPSVASSADPLIVETLRRALVLAIVLIIRIYQAFVRPFLIGSCKFHPTCSEYAASVVQVHGPLRGSILAVKRLLRCHPFSPGGLDPVPPTEHGKSISGGENCSAAAHANLPSRACATKPRQASGNAISGKKHPGGSA